MADIVTVTPVGGDIRGTKLRTCTGASVEVAVMLICPVCAATRAASLVALPVTLPTG